MVKKLDRKQYRKITRAIFSDEKSTRMSTAGTWFKSSFENGAADDEWQRAFFRVFFSKPLVGMKQTIRCWIDIVEVAPNP